MIWYCHLFKTFPQFVVIHTVKGFIVVLNEAEVFLEFPSFLCSMDRSSGCWHFHLWFLCLFCIQLVHLDVLCSHMKPAWRILSNYPTSMWNEHSYSIVEHALALPFFGIEMKMGLFQSCGHCWVLQICLNIECSTLTASSFRIMTTSGGICHFHWLCL